MEKLLSIVNLKKYFPVAKSGLFHRTPLYVRANEDISIDIYQGETFGLVGESGCGKSTLGRVLLQLYEQTAGSTMYYGRTLEAVAPAYVMDTLKNADQYIARYRRAAADAAAAAEHCDRLGENAAFFDLQKKNLAQAEAKTALDRVAKILGGFMVRDTKKGAALLQARYACAVAAAKVEARMEDCRLSAELLAGTMAEKQARGERTDGLARRVGRLEARRQQLQEQLDELQRRADAAMAAVEAAKAPYREEEEFSRYEAMLDQGIDLSRLNEREMRVLRKDLQIIFQD